MNLIQLCLIASRISRIVAHCVAGCCLLCGVGRLPAQDPAAPPLADPFHSSTTIVKSTSVADEVMARIRDRDLDGALQRLRATVDGPLAIRDLVYSDLPSAAGGIHRSLSQQRTDQQYEQLEAWTLPDAGRESVRMLTVPVPADAPPKVFARAIGERPRDSTFAVASVGPVEGLFCSGWMFVLAAEDLGRLPRLRVTLESLVDDGVQGAEPLWMLAQLAGSRGELELVNQYLQQRAATAAEIELTPEDIHTVAIAAAAILHPETQAASETFLDSLVNRGAVGYGIELRPLLRIAHATAVQAYRGESPPEALFQDRLTNWVPSTVRSAKEIERGHPDGVWLTHEQHILHLAGGTADVLFFRYPLVGEFDFIAETQEGGSIGTDGGLVYGGLHFLTLGRKDQLIVRDPDNQHEIIRPSPFARFDNGPTFNRVSIRSLPDGCQFESNFHPVWFDGLAAQSSPFIGLRSSGTKRPLFRNLRITGSPTIPERVDLIAGDQLRGWESGFYSETQLPFRDARSQSDDQDQTGVDWMLRAGQLTGSGHDEAEAAANPGWLRYQRPLLAEESVSYEFLFDGPGTIVHPSLGRLAFLLEENGVRVRWITTGNSEWTGLEIDNAALEPLNRRGPRPLPLRKADWNVVVLQRSADKVLVKLNDELIYQRPMESNQSTKFGLYRAGRSEPTQIRNITLVGDWPTTVPGELLTQTESE